MKTIEMYVIEGVGYMEIEKSTPFNRYLTLEELKNFCKNETIRDLYIFFRKDDSNKKYVFFLTKVSNPDIRVTYLYGDNLFFEEINCSFATKLDYLGFYSPQDDSFYDLNSQFYNLLEHRKLLRSEKESLSSEVTAKIVSLFKKDYEREGNSWQRAADEKYFSENQDKYEESTRLIAQDAFEKRQKVVEPKYNFSQFDCCNVSDAEYINSLSNRDEFILEKATFCCTVNDVRNYLVRMYFMERIANRILAEYEADTSAYFHRQRKICESIRKLQEQSSNLQYVDVVLERDGITFEGKYKAWVLVKCFENEYNEFSFMSKDEKRFNDVFPLEKYRCIHSFKADDIVAIKYRKKAIYEK